MNDNKGKIKGNVEERLNVSGLAPGVYYIGIYGDGKKLRAEKFVKN
jgi:hypothetical protein